METFGATLWMVLLCRYLSVISACNTFITRPHTHGYRCEANSGEGMELYQVKFPQCVWRCTMQETCPYINHNSTTDQCNVGLGSCESVGADVGFLLKAFGPPRQDCLHWGSSEEPGRVPVQVEQNSYCIYVARIINEDKIFLGKFNPNSGKYYANNEVVDIGPILHTDQGIEILTKDVTAPCHGWPTRQGRHYLMELWLEVVLLTSYLHMSQRWSIQISA